MINDKLLSKEGNEYCHEPTRRPRCGKGISASISIGKRISLPQCGSVHIRGLVRNSKLCKGEDCTIAAATCVKIHHDHYRNS